MIEQRSAKTSASLSHRLIVLIVLFSSCVTLVVTAIQVYREYRADIAYIDEQFGQIEQSFIDSVRQSLWLFDEAQIVSQLEGILRLRDVAHVAILKDGQELYAAGKAMETQGPNRQIRLTTVYNGQTLELGTLSIHATLDGVNRRLLDRIGIILASNAFKTFAVALFFYFLFEKLVTRHIGHVAGFLRQVRLDGLAKPLTLDRRPRASGAADELDDLTSSINQMRINLQASLAERQLATRRFEAGQDQLGVGAWDWDVATRTMSWSHGVAGILGLDDRDVAPSYEAYMRAVHPEDIPVARAAIRRALKEDRDFVVEHRVLWPDGTVRWVHGRGNLLRRADGRAEKLAGLVVDISDRKAAENELRDAKERAESYLEIAEAIIVELDSEGRIAVINARGCEILGAEADELVGQNWFEVALPEEKRAATFAYFESLMRGEADVPEYYENAIVTRSGEHRVIAWHNVIVRNDANRIAGTLSSGQDITRRLEAEAALRRSQKMEAVGQLTGGIAHDFNNLMAVMLGSAEMLEDLIAADPQARRYLAQVTRSVERGAALTQRLLAFSRMQALKPQGTDINALLTDLGEMLRRTLGATIEFSIRPAPHLGLALVDAGQLEHAIVNLALNAKHAMPQGGRLSIATRDVFLRVPVKGHVGEVAPGEYVEISVQDSGTGMEPQVLERVFEPFFTTKDVGEGSGLGLSMVYGFAAQSNGHVLIDSVPGAGTVVRLYLPRAARAGIARPKTAGMVPPPAPPATDGRILFLEDDDLARQVPAEILRRHGYEVAEARDGQTALALLKSGGPFDLLLTDVALPGGMSGIEVAEEAEKLQPGIRILFATGYCEGDPVAGVKQQDGATVLMKPYPRAELLAAVERMLAPRSQARVRA